MNKFETYFGQIITSDELNEIFASFSTAIEKFILDYGYKGIAVGAELAQNTTPNMSVLVGGPAAIYDQAGNRITWSSPVNVNLALDENNVSTAVTSAGQERWVSVFVKFVSTPSDPREDDLGTTVYFRKLAGYEFKIVAGAVAPTNTAPRPPLRADQILIGDVKVRVGQTAVITADIDSSRAQTVFDLTGTPLSIKGRGIQQVLQSMLNALNSVTVGPDTIIVPAIPGTPDSLVQATLRQDLAALLALINALKIRVGSAEGEIDGVQTDLTGVARLAGANTFTNTNTFLGANNFVDLLFVQNVDCDRALLGTSRVPTEHPSKPTNKWKKLLEFKFGSSAAGGQYIRIYTGSDGSAHGCFVVPTNASWNVSTQVWEKRDNALPSTALIWAYNRLHIVTEPSTSNGGRATFADWETSLPTQATPSERGLGVNGDVIVDGFLHASRGIRAEQDLVTDGSLQVAGNITGYGNITGGNQTSDHITIGGDLNLGRDALVSGKARANYFETSGVDMVPLKYPSYQPRQSVINLASGVGESDIFTSEAKWIYIADQEMWVGRLPGSVSIPLHLPWGARLRLVRAVFNKPSTTTIEFRVFNGTSEYGPAANGEPAHVNGFNAEMNVVNLMGGDHPQGIVVDINRVTLKVKNTSYSMPGGSAPPWGSWPYLERVVVYWDDPGLSNSRS